MRDIGYINGRNIDIVVYGRQKRRLAFKGRVIQHSIEDLN